jgi:hypothetical protein
MAAKDLQADLAAADALLTVRRDESIAAAASWLGAPRSASSTSRLPPHTGTRRNTNAIAVQRAAEKPN